MVANGIGNIEIDIPKAISLYNMYGIFEDVNYLNVF